MIFVSMVQEIYRMLSSINLPMLRKKIKRSQSINFWELEYPDHKMSDRTVAGFLLNINHLVTYKSDSKKNFLLHAFLDIIKLY